MYTSPLIPAPSTFQTAQSEITSYHTPAASQSHPPSTTFTSAQSELSTYRTPASQSTYQATAYTFGDGSSVVTAQTAQTYVPRGQYTADPSSPIERSERTSYFTPAVPLVAVPLVAITGASPRQSTAYGSAETGSEYRTAGDSGLSEYQTAPAASSKLGSPFMLSDEKASVKDKASTKGKATSQGSSTSGSERSYQTAPPPVPSRDSKYMPSTFGAETTTTAVRYQLHDAPVPSRSYSDTRSYGTAPPASITEIYETAASKPTDYFTAQTKSTEYFSGSRALSFSSEMQERAETATHISDGTDYDLIADLERQSSAGSALVRRRPTGARTRSYDSAPSRSTIREGAQTVYQTAGESAYATAPSWHATSYYTAPDPGSSKPSSASTAQSTTNGSKIRRVPVPSIPPPSPSQPSSIPSSVPPSDPGTVPSYSDGTAKTRAGFGYDLSRMMVSCTIYLLW